MQGLGRFTEFCLCSVHAMMEIGRDAATNARPQEQTMRVLIETVAAALLVCCISATSAAFAVEGKAARPGVQADGLSCAFSVGRSASPAARCAAIRAQCGGKFHANACGERMLSAT
jgi:hypothetical protein